MGVYDVICFLFDRMSYLYTYSDLHAGRLVKRYKRFFADVELETGEIVTAHCPNTGPMTGVCTVGSRVYVSKNDNPKRKLAYTWEMIEVEETWVGINTGIPNKITKLLLEKKLLEPLADCYKKVRPEVPYGTDKGSRIDFLLTYEEQDLFSFTSPKPDIYVEVKNVTLAEGNLALFPDTETTRGQKHLKEMMNLVPESRAVMLYFIDRKDCDQFTAGDRYDPTYGKLLREAIAKGVEVLPCRFEVTPEGIKYLGLAKLIWI